jgi:hypothetical protein
MDPENRSLCVRAVEQFYPECAVKEFEEQGQCSYTLLVSGSKEILRLTGTSERVEHECNLDREEDPPFIVQIRPEQYVLDLHIARTAKAVYPQLAPAVRAVDLGLSDQLREYEMEQIRGTSLVRLLPKGSQVEPFPQMNYERLIECFAAFLAQGWQSTSKSLPKRNTRADSPMDDKPSMLSQCTGRVGSSIVARLGKLSKELPGEHMRQIAANTLERLGTIEDYPVVLNHGDLIPSNILVDEDTWEITGIVDWAEAEYLPFGTCLYGLELLLGNLTPAFTRQLHDNLAAASTSPSFTHFTDASDLRNLFWTRLFELAPEIKRRREDVKTMRDMGVLLWYGYAWDDGAINRVVNEVDDPNEMACLRAFLDVA